MKSYMAKAETMERKWYIVDAEGMVLGRLASQVAAILRGKHKPIYTPHVDCGDHVVIINADKVKLTGNKWEDRTYVSYTGYPGGQRYATPAILQKKSEIHQAKARGNQRGKHPLFLHVIKGMLPKNKLGAQILNNVYIYNGPEHPHEAQQPKVIDINKLK